MGEKEDKERDEAQKALDAANRAMHQNKIDLAYLLMEQMNRKLEKEAAEAKKKAEEDRKKRG